MAAMIIMAAVGLTCHIAAANEPADHRAESSNTGTIRITADKLIAELGAEKVEFSGNVKAQQSGTVITADRLTIAYNPSAVSQKKDSLKTDAIRKITASGRVKIAYDNIVAEGDYAEYTMISKVFVLTGKPSRLSRNGHWISGPKITLQRSDGTLTVEGSGEGRVRAIFKAD